MSEILSSTTILAVIGFVFTSLLACVVYFLDRLIKQFDNLSIQFGTLNDTMKKIDKDLSGDVGLLKQENVAIRASIDDFDTLWERVRKVEHEIVSIQAGGCAPHIQCSVNQQ